MYEVALRWGLDNTRLRSDRELEAIWLGTKKKILSNLSQNG